MKSFLLIPCLVASTAIPVSAAVYMNDAVIDDSENIPVLAGFGLGRVFYLTQSPNGHVVVTVNRIGSTQNFEFLHQSIAAYYSLCVVNAGDSLTYLNITSKPTLGGPGGGNTLTLNPGQEAYIGYWSQRGSTPPNPTPQPNSIIGWAKVTNTAGTLVLVSSVSADTGIIVGTAQSIPEPSSALIASATSLLLLRRRNRG